MKKEKKTVKPRNPYALALESPIFRQKIKESKKRRYNRQKDKEESRKAVKEDTAFSFARITNNRNHFAISLRNLLSFICSFVTYRPSENKA